MSSSLAYCAMVCIAGSDAGECILFEYPFANLVCGYRTLDLLLLASILNFAGTELEEESKQYHFIRTQALEK